jgi:hypothetical protein
VLDKEDVNAWTELNLPLAKALARKTLLHGRSLETA